MTLEQLTAALNEAVATLQVIAEQADEPVSAALAATAIRKIRELGAE